MSTNDKIELMELRAKVMEATAILKALTTNKHLNLGDLVYAVREREGKGWDGPSVTAWGRAVGGAMAFLKKEGV